MHDYAVIAAYYDLEHEGLTDDIALYRQFARAEGSPILVLGAGTGRVSHALLRDEHEVWSVDRSPEMLGIARRRLDGVAGSHIVEADLTELDLPVRFAMAVAPLDVFSHLPGAAEQQRALGGLKRHLVPGGLLVLDLANPHTLPSQEENGIVRERFRECAEGRAITVWISIETDAANQTIALHLSYDVSVGGPLTRQQTTLRLRWVYRYELELLLAAAGFDVDEVYGDYELGQYATNSPRLIVTARAR